MTVLASRLDTQGAAFRANAGRMAERLAEVRALEARVVAESESRRARFDERGQLLPRERVARLLDRGSGFLELSSLAGLGMHDDDGRKSVQGGGSIVGIGTVAGKRVLVSASDSGIKGGTVAPMGLKKALRAQALARENKLPLVSLVENPLGLQNRLLRIDTDSQVMTELVTLPPAREPSSANPFGVVGLAFDCETGSLYASSLAGSTASEELGRIFQVEAASGRLRSQLDGVDAMGLGVFRGSGGKRLYFGRTRSPELHSVALDATGAFVGAPRLELSLADQVRGGLATPRRLRFGAGPQLRLHMMDFNYSLQVAAEREEREIDLRYDPAGDRWQLIAADG